MTGNKALLVNTGTRINGRSRAHRCPPKCKKFRNTFVYSRGGLVVLAWTLLQGLLFVVVGDTPLNLRLNLKNDIYIYSTATSVALILCYLLYPVFGVLGEKWLRYKMIIVASLFVSVSFILFNIILCVYYIDKRLEDHKICFFFIGMAVLTPFFIGQVMLGSNMIQFGVDQFPFASSNEISSFIHWYFGSLFLCVTITLTILIIVSSVLAAQILMLRFIIVTFTTGMCVIVTASTTVCCFRKHLIIEPPQHTNPVKLIWAVSVFALKHSRPLRRSAFTFGEDEPSRFDLAKERYGGPFTTVTVENVKSFWFITGLLFAAFGFIFQDSTADLASCYLKYLNNASNTSTYSLLQTITLDYYTFVPKVTTVIVLLAHQFVLVPFFSNYIPGMLKRIWLGLMGVMIKESILTTLSTYIYYDSDTHCDDICNATQLPHYLLLLIPQLIDGITTVLVFVTSGVFILAQGPRNMQGLLIGLWLMVYSYFGIHIPSFIHSIKGCDWYYYAAKTIIIALSVITYSIAAYKYRYRQLNETSDINERSIITRYVERQLNVTQNTDTEKEMSSSEINILQ